MRGPSLVNSFSFMQGIRKFLKRYLPKTLFGRALLILLLPILLLQAVVAAIFIQRHYYPITDKTAGVEGRGRAPGGAVAGVSVGATGDRREAVRDLRLRG